MKKKRFQEEKILRILKEAEAGKKIVDICREYGISDVTFYRWRSIFSGLDIAEARRLKKLEKENARLKRLLADTMLDKEILQEIVEKKL